jgi:hypothetical protein
MRSFITRECSNSDLHLAQIRIQVGICHLERVTAKKLESIHTTDATVPIERLKNNRVLCVAELRALSIVVVDQHGEARMALHQSRNVGVLGPGQQIPFPVAGNRSVFYLRRSFADGDGIDDLSS